MSHISRTPPIWIIVMIAIVPLVSEAIYTPSLPEIAHDLKTSISSTEHTLAIYLFGFAFGVFLWGTRADANGRRPVILMGYTLFSIACIGCFFSKSIEALMAWRFVQGLGGAVGSVMGQTLARDGFKGKERGVVFSTVGMAITVGPGLGPVIGGIIVQNFHWSFIFLILLVISISTIISVYIHLPETHPDFDNRHNRIRWGPAVKKMAKDPQIITCILVVGSVAGTKFSIYSEAPFYFIETLNIKPSEYGFIFPFVSLFAISGGFISRYYNKKGVPPTELILKSLVLMVVAVFLWTIFVLTKVILIETPTQSIFISICFIAILNLTFGIVIPNTLSLALTKYGHMAGTAGALFGFSYYLIISLVTYGMGGFHNGTLLIMPLYFTIILAVCLGLFLINKGKLEHDY
jgi:Bcr/CflA subfamily drug resistance transporter